jgi:hypothetical protein
MKLGYICVIQRQKNDLRSEDKGVNLNQKRFNTGVTLHGGGMCFLGQRQNTAGEIPQKVCNNHSKLLHISLGQSKADIGPQMTEDAVEISVVFPGQCLLTYGCHHVTEFG